MCKHVRTAFDTLGYKNDTNYFLQFKDWTDAKNKLLQPYGLTIADEESKAFKFTISYFGELQMQAPKILLQLILFQDLTLYPIPLLILKQASFLTLTASV